MSDADKDLVVSCSESNDDKIIIANLSTGDVQTTKKLSFFKEPDHDSVAALNKSEGSGTTSSEDMKPLVWIESDSVEEELAKHSEAPLKKMFGKLESDVKDSSDDDFVLRWDDDDENDDNVCSNEEMLLNDDDEALKDSGLGDKANIKVQKAILSDAKADGTCSKADEYNEWNLRHKNVSTPLDDALDSSVISYKMSKSEADGHHLLVHSLDSNPKPHGLINKDCMIEIPTREIEDLDESLLLDDSDDNLNENATNLELDENQEKIKSDQSPIEKNETKDDNLKSKTSPNELEVSPLSLKDTEIIKASKNHNKQSSTNVDTSELESSDILNEVDNNMLVDDNCSQTESANYELSKESKIYAMSEIDKMDIDIEENFIDGEEVSNEELSKETLLDDGDLKVADSIQESSTLKVNTNIHSSQCIKRQPDKIENHLSKEMNDNLHKNLEPELLSYTEECTTTLKTESQENNVNIKKSKENEKSEENILKETPILEKNVPLELVTMAISENLKKISTSDEIVPMEVDKHDGEMLEKTKISPQFKERENNIKELMPSGKSTEFKDQELAPKILDSMKCNSEKDETDSQLISEQANNDTLPLGSKDGSISEDSQPTNILKEISNNASSKDRSKDAQSTKILEEIPSIPEDKTVANSAQATEIVDEIFSLSKDGPKDAPATEILEVMPSTSKMVPKDAQANDIVKEMPSTSKDVSKDAQTTEIVEDKEIPQKSIEEPEIAEEILKTSKYIEEEPDQPGEVPESDSLGLLAESSRMMDDDEEQDEEQEADDDDDDFDPDDESNQPLTGDNSEDSNDTPSKPDDQPDSGRESELLDTPQDTREPSEVVTAIDEITEEIHEPTELTETADETSELLKTDEEQLTTALHTDMMASDVADVKEQEQASEDAVKISTDTEKARAGQLLKSLLTSKQKHKKQCKSPAKSADQHVVDIEDSSEDDVQEEMKPDKSESEQTGNLTSVNLPSGIDVMSVSTSQDGGSKMVAKNGELIIAGLPKPPPKKTSARLNTSELTIKTAKVTDSEPALTIPEIGEPFFVDKEKEAEALEVFELDSDDDDCKDAVRDSTETPRRTMKCVNSSCPGESSTYYAADVTTLHYYNVTRRRGACVCEPCADVVYNTKEDLIKGIRDFKPLLELEMKKTSLDLVEISDSESDEETEPQESENKEVIGADAAKFLEENLAEMLNSTWVKFKLDERLKDSENFFNEEFQRLEKECQEVNRLLNDCQAATDRLRNEFYGTFEKRKQATTALIIIDTPHSQIQALEEPLKTGVETRRSKRRLSNAADPSSKRTNTESKAEEKDDDNVDISVVKLSAEAAPDTLPPPGEISRPAIYVGMAVYAMKNQFGAWLPARVTEILNKANQSQNVFTMVRVKFDHKTTKNQYKALPARSLAYAEPCKVRMTIGTRVIALFKDENKRESYYSGVVAEVPNPVNNYRYLVFFDDGYAQYVDHPLTRLVCECSTLVWEEVHPFSREFVKNYLTSYPERPMVRLHSGQKLKTEWNGKWWICKVLEVDASLAQIYFEEDKRTEWIYRGSTRLAPLYLELQAANKQRTRPMPRSTNNKAQPKLNMPYVEYTREDANSKQSATDNPQKTEELRRQRSVAKKSTAAPPPQIPRGVNLDAVTSRVVYYTPKNAVKPYDMVPHRCGPHCQRTDTLALRDLRTYNPLAKPLLSGWQRQIVRFKGAKEVMYVAPCGRRLRNIRELHRYLQMVESDMSVDLFDFGANTHCLAEFVLNKCNVSKKDLSHGKENVPVPCVNYYDNSLPEFCSYNTERTPTAGVPLMLDPEFLCGCDCEDDCEDKSKCACWQMTLEGARTIQMEGEIGYTYRRLPEPLPTGIYECNVRCKCKQTCLNRVAQHPLQLKLQVFKTMNRGWGIRALNDVPKGAFLCVYAGNLLTDATANLDGLNEGDEYLAELDYIEVVEQMKEGYEEDIPDEDKRMDRFGSNSDAEDTESSEEEAQTSRNEEDDRDFNPDRYVPKAAFTKDLRKRNKKEKKNKEKKTDNKPTADGECITISDDEEVREPSRFMAEAGMDTNEYVSKYRSVRSYFGKDEKCYIMDAKVQGNIGRYLNHSCSPNVFVQNVFVDTHDPRFPWVAFFALSHIKAGTELTWNYNYDIGSVPGKILYCYCGVPNCRGRLL